MDLIIKDIEYKDECKTCGPCITYCVFNLILFPYYVYSCFICQHKL